MGLSSSTCSSTIITTTARPPPPSMIEGGQPSAASEMSPSSTNPPLLTAIPVSSCGGPEGRGTAVQGRNNNINTKNIIIGLLVIALLVLSHAFVYMLPPRDVREEVESPSFCSTAEQCVKEFRDHLGSVSFSLDEQAMEWVIENSNASNAVQYGPDFVARMTQRYALATLSFANNAQTEPGHFCWEKRDNWTREEMKGLHECDWFGDAVECSFDKKWVTGIRVGLYARGSIEDHGDILSLRCFVGKLPPDLALLSNLTTISMNGQDFQQGTVPESWFGLTSLTTLYLSSSLLGGGISSNLRQLSNLVLFDVSRNLLQGELPPNLEALSKINVFRVDVNKLSGTIPESAQSWESVEELVLHMNNFKGSISSNIGRMTNLRILTVQGNKWLTGHLPQELGELVKLETFHAFGTAIVGPQNPFCDSGRNYSSLALDCDRIPCPCCKEERCCRPEIDRLVCQSPFCDVCNSTNPLIQFPCSETPGLVDELWRATAMTCNCRCRR